MKVTMYNGKKLETMSNAELTKIAKAAYLTVDKPTFDAVCEIMEYRLANDIMIKESK